MHRKPQHGNILFLILLAVVLFAALSYAVTSSLRGGGQDASSENAQTGAAAISQYVTLLRNEVQRLMLVNDCKVTNLDWRDGVYKRYDGTSLNGTGAPLVPKTGCAIFQAYGGPVTPQSFEKYGVKAYEDAAQGSSNWPMGGGGIRWSNRKNEGTPANDMVILFIAMQPALCSYLLDPATKPAVVSDASSSLVLPNNAQPADYTASTDIIDEPVNLAGQFYATLANYFSATIKTCTLGAVILPQ